MTRLDHNRAIAQLAPRPAPRHRHQEDDDLGQPLGHPVPRPLPRRGRGKNAAELVNDQAWLENDFIPTVAKRGAAIIEARGVVGGLGRQRRDRPRPRLGARHPDGDWVSMAVPSDGSYGVPEGLISSFPVTTIGRRLEIVQGLDIDDFSRGRIDASSPSSPRSATPSRSSA
jgi:malate dehydrogenase